MDAFANDSVGADYLVCPNCNQLTDAQENWWPVGDLYLGMVFGFYLVCDKCKKKSFINLLQIGKPPLFDLSKHYQLVSREND